jgi:hypothetical protein
MMLNPCTAPLVKGSFGHPDKTVTRVASRFNYTIPVGQTMYVLWFPEFSSRSSSAATGVGLDPFEQFNALYYVGPTASAPPNLGGAGNWAYAYNWANVADSITNNEGGFLVDPASTMNDGKYTDDLTTIAACIDISYTGRADSSAGQICLIPQIDADEVIRVSANASDTVPLVGVTTDLLFGRSNEGNISRLGGNTHTVRWAANDMTTDHDRATGPFIAGIDTIGTGTTNSGGYRTQAPAPSGIGFAIAGTDGASPITFTLTKIVEWSPGDWLNQVNPSPQGMRPAKLTLAQKALPTAWATLRREATEAWAKHATKENFAKLAIYAGEQLAGAYYPMSGI